MHRWDRSAACIAAWAAICAQAWGQVEVQPSPLFELQRAGGVHVAWSPSQSWHVELGERGSRVWPADGSWSWGLGLESFGRTGEVREVEAAAELAAEGPRLTYRWGGGVEEWYEHRSDGLEHGFTLLERPAGSGETLEITLRIDGNLKGGSSRDGRDLVFEDTLGVARLDYSHLVVLDAHGRELAATWELCEGRMTLLIDDRGAAYPVLVDPIAQRAYVKASNAEGKDYFGWSAATAGDTLVVGAVGEDSAATGVNGDPLDNSAYDVGAAFVFRLVRDEWQPEAYLKSSLPLWNNHFGTSTATEGDVIVVGAPGESLPGDDGPLGDDAIPFAGAVYVFERIGSRWEQGAKLLAERPESFGQFGRSVAVDEGRVVVGAPGESGKPVGPLGHTTSAYVDSVGAAYVFERVDGSWTMTARLTAPNAGKWDGFGVAVAVEGDCMLVGAMGESGGHPGVDGDMSDDSLPGSGAVYVLRRTGTTWSHEAYVKAVNPGVGDNFGQTLALSGETFVVGAPDEDCKSAGVNGDPFDDHWLWQSTGAAYVFVRSGASWTQEAYLKASNPKQYSYFGRAVACEGDRIVVGSPGESGKATGIHGNQFGTETASGAAYLFERTGGGWSQKAYVKASNTDAFDSFGGALSLSSGRLVIGAPGEGSAIAGDPRDDSAQGAGAAYVFDLDADYTPYCAQIKPTSVPGCHAMLSCSDPTLSTGAWQATDIPRSLIAGPGTSIGVFLYTHGVGIGPSLSFQTPSYGLLCLTEFQASAPAYRPALLDGALPGVCNSGLMRTELASAASALGLAVGEDVNVQLWYRDYSPPAQSRLSNAIHYTLK